MKKILVRVGFIVAIAAVAAGVESTHGGSAEDVPQVTKQYCC